MKKDKKNLRTPGKLIVILGPTASGKSEFAVRLASRFNLRRVKKTLGINGAEIISADSKQVYRGMDIGTSKATKKEMMGIPHYLIDIAAPNKKFNVALYKRLAIKTIKSVHKKGKLPILAGGTGLYIRAVVDNIAFPETPPNKKLRVRLEKKSAAGLFKIYEKLDPKGATSIDKKNKRRLIRAIEVCKSTGKPFWDQRKKSPPIFDVLQIGIKLPSEKVREKIEKRVKKMFGAGLEKEVKGLAGKYGWPPLLQTIGYGEWRDYFGKKIPKSMVKDLIIMHTNQFVKRQMTWFKRDKRIRWVKNYREAERATNRFLQTRAKKDP